MSSPHFCYTWDGRFMGNGLEVKMQMSFSMRILSGNDGIREQKTTDG